jgi:MYXO-CTERM domain-containing protein
MRPEGGGGPATTENLAFYYLELRTPLDFDGTLSGGSALSPRVLVHVADERRTRTQRGVHTFLLDMHPATTGSTSLNDAGLAAGESFTDPAGTLTITAQSVTSAGATIVVSYSGGVGAGAPTCIDGSAFAPPGPGMESCETTAVTGSGGTAGGAAGGSDGTTGLGGAIMPAGEGGSSGGSAPAESGLTKGCACDASGASGGAPRMTMLASLLLGVAVSVLRRRTGRSNRPRTWFAHRIRVALGERRGRARRHRRQ